MASQETMDKSSGQKSFKDLSYDFNPGGQGGPSYCQVHSRVNGIGPHLMTTRPTRCALMPRFLTLSVVKGQLWAIFGFGFVMVCVFSSLLESNTPVKHKKVQCP